MATTARTDRTRPARPRKTTAARTPKRDGASRSVATVEPVEATEHPTTHATAEHLARHPHEAAEKARHSTRTRVNVPFLGHVDLPPADELAYIAGIGALAVVGVVEWPVAVVLGAGHALANRRRNRLLREFGEALERV
jgi:predicted flap endonuclease-1-like 5' DNA nuclease